MRTIGCLVAYATLSCGITAPAVAEIVENRNNRTIAVPEVLGGNILEMSRFRDDCDDIRLNLVQMPVGSSVPGLRLRTGPDTWGKRVEVFVDGILRGTLDAPGNGGTSARVDLIPDEHYKVQLLFVKPKAFGVLTPFYQIVGLRRFSDQDMEIVWVDDRC